MTQKLPDRLLDTAPKEGMLNLELVQQLHRSKDALPLANRDPAASLRDAVRHLGVFSVRPVLEQSDWEAFLG